MIILICLLINIVGRAILKVQGAVASDESTLGNAAKRNELPIQYCGEERIVRGFF